MCCWVSLKEAKKHLQVEDDFTDDDEYIQNLICVSEQAVKKHLNLKCNEYAINECIGCPYEVFCLYPPSPVKHAVLLMIGNLYANREPIAFNTVAKLPLSYDYLLSLYKQY